MIDRRRNGWIPLALLRLTLSGWCRQLTVQTSDAKQIVLTRADLESLPHAKITIGAAASQKTFEGVPLSAVLQKAGVEFGEAFKGKRLASWLVVELADGYRVVIALPELDPPSPRSTSSWPSRGTESRSTKRMGPPAS